MVFYWAGVGTLTLLLLASIITNALIGFILVTGNADNSALRKQLIIGGVVFNLLVLCTFKYSSLILSSINTLAPAYAKLSPTLIQGVASIPLPLGISFFCFEGISLTIDTSKRLLERRLSWIDTLCKSSLFFSFFPHLISGPILRAGHFFPQIRTKCFREIDWYVAFKWLTLGYFLKSFVANNLADYTWFVKYPYFTTAGTITNVLLLCGYSAQIFADFAGYSFMAVGLAELLGYKIPNNFNAPYISRSLGEFWKRWHISLSSWLKDYLFIPLGGSRCSRTRACLNVFVVMILGGLWHGASWNYAIWGAMHGAGLIVEHIFRSTIPIPESVLLGVGKIVVVNAFVTAAWIGFIMSDVNHMKLLAKHLCTDFAIMPYAKTLPVLGYILPVAALHAWHWASERGLTIGNLLLKSDFFRMFVYATLIFLAAVNPGTPHEFIYFQF
jgi:alginate O-acetyltransferase complex protein AlgI